MSELKYIENYHHFNNVNTFTTVKVSANADDTKYVTYTFENGTFTKSDPLDGTPDIKYHDLVWIKSCKTMWTHGELYMTTDPSAFVTYDEFSPVSTAALNSITKGTLHTINGQSIEEQDIVLDLSLYKIVSELPTTDILNNKIYMVRDASSTASKNVFNEYIYNDTVTPAEWELIGQITSEIDLSGYLTKTEADKKYVEKSDNPNASITTGNTGAMSNFSDNGQAYLAVRPKGQKFIINTPYAGASFGVKDDSTAAFTHKTYTTFNKDTGAYTGAKNTAVLQFAGPVGLRYAKNTGGGNDVTEDMYKYVGVIDSPDEKQCVYSKKQVDDLLKALTDRIEELENQLNPEP